MPNKQYLQNVPLSSLREWTNNYRSIHAEAISHLKNKIRELGVFKPLLAIASSEPGTYQIIGGNQRLKAYRELGIETADLIFYPDLTDKKIIAKIALADNQSDGFTDPEKLLKLCQDAELFYDDLTDFELQDCSLQLADVFPQEEVPSEYDDQTPALDEGPAFTQPGDIFILGRHRLICGDSTQSETWARLMGDEVADLLLTDPPYNVDYEGANGKKIANDKISASDFAAFLGNAFGTVSAFLRPGAAFYIWYADKEITALRNACDVSGLSVRQGLVWVKNHFVLGRQDYQWRHEPCLYGWKDGGSHYFTKDRTQSTVLDFAKPAKSNEHPTMKPAALMAQLVVNSTRKGGIVADGFGGSGSTLIACELKGRSCRMAELSPDYCDIIVKRFHGLNTAADCWLIRNGERSSVDPLVRGE